MPYSLFPLTNTASFRSALILALIVVSILSLDPAPELPAVLWDKANHAAAYVLLAFLADRSFPEKQAGLPHPAKFICLFAYGMAIEGLQSLIPQREASMLDLVANACGLALYAAAVVTHRRRQIDI